MLRVPPRWVARWVECRVLQVPKAARKPPRWARSRDVDKRVGLRRPHSVDNRCAAKREHKPLQALRAKALCRGCSRRRPAHRVLQAALRWRARSRVPKAVLKVGQVPQVCQAGLCKLLQALQVRPRSRGCRISRAHKVPQALRASRPSRWAVLRRAQQADLRPQL